MTVYVGGGGTTGGITTTEVSYEEYETMPPTQGRGFIGVHNPAPLNAALTPQKGQAWPRGSRYSAG